MNKEISSLHKIQRKRRIILSGVGLCFFAIILYVVLFLEDPDEQKYESIKEKIDKIHQNNIAFIDNTRKNLGIDTNANTNTATEPGTDSHTSNSSSQAIEDQESKKKKLIKRYMENAEETRKQMREIRDEIKKLKPETRKKLVKALMHARLDEARRKAAHLSDREKKEIVQKMVARVRKRFNSLSPEEKEKRRKKFNSPKGKKRVKEAMNFYMNELSAKERELLDPLVREMMINLDTL